VSATNIFFLAAGLALQLSLLTLLFNRRLASQLYLFTFLLGFYTVRSVLLVVLFRLVSPGLYFQLYIGLSVLDVLLQIALAIELSNRILREGRGPYPPRAIGIAATFLSAAALTAVIAALLPSHSRAPADRGSIFTGLVFIGLLLWSVQLPRWPRVVLIGFAALGAAGILTQLGRSVAATHQDAHAFRLWSYAGAAAYLVALAFWIAQCIRDRNRLLEPRHTLPN
jgi:hypothetical protein